MSPGQWEQVKQIVAAAQELPPAERAAWIERACPDDEGVRKEAESLLAALDANTSDALEKPAAEAYVPPVRDPMEGRRLGPYRLQHKIGSGGMGDVYVAARDDDQFRKRVAVKVVRPGVHEQDGILGRFRTERQALAALDHPNIVKLLDAGTTPEGLPYLVMDYVEGVPIDVFCDRNKLSISDRLKIFVSVCHAVHYAHQNLVIHRDLKPGNLLVTASGAAKLLDFGIAKLLNPGLGGGAVQMTRLDSRPMTPLYASPEQLRGEPVTTASDVYSLGVILYQLLTGHPPYGVDTANSMMALEQAICEVQPEKPSDVITRTTATVTPADVSQTREGHPQKLQRRLAGDLDVIVLMAMRKEPQRRYASAEQFAGDIERHLEGRPVLARADTAGYRMAKFVQRNRFPVVAAAAAALALVGGAVASFTQAQRAERERARAERRFGDVRQLANWFLFDFHGMIRDLPGSTAARKQLVSKSLEYLDGLAREASGDASLQSELASAYMKVGEVQYNPTAANLGDPAGGLESLKKAVEAAGRAHGSAPDNERIKVILAQAYKGLASMQGVLGRTRAAVTNLHRACGMLESVKTRGPQESAELARCLIATGDSLGHPYFPNVGDGPGAMAAYRKALAIADGLAAGTTSGEARNLNLGQLVYSAAQRVGDMLEMRDGNHQEALVQYERALGVISKVAAEEPANASARRSLGIIHHRLGQALEQMGDIPKAGEHHRQALAITEELAAADPKNAEARRSLSLSHQKIGDHYGKAGDMGKALDAHRRSVAISEALYVAEPANLTIRRDLAIAHRNVGRVLERGGQTAAAYESYTRAVRHYDEMVKAEPGNGQYRSELSDQMEATISMLEKSGAGEEARVVRGRWMVQLKDFAGREEATEADRERYAKAQGSGK